MLPELFRLGPIPIRSFGLMVVVGTLVALWMGMRRATRFRIPKEGLVELAFWMVLIGVIGARLVYVALEWKSYSQNPLAIFKFYEGGITSFGGILFGLLTMAIWSRRAKVSFARVLDLAAAPVLVAFGLGRIGCFLNGCCHGGPCELPIAVHFPNVPYAAHPAQLYDTAMNWLWAAILLWIERRSLVNGLVSLSTGTLAALGFVFFGVSRFIYEIFRIGASSEPVVEGAPITGAQLAAIFMVAFGLLWLLRLQWKRPATAHLE